MIDDILLVNRCWQVCAASGERVCAVDGGEGLLYLAPVGLVRNVAAPVTMLDKTQLGMQQSHSDQRGTFLSDQRRLSYETGTC